MLFDSDMCVRDKRYHSAIFDCEAKSIIDTSEVRLPIYVLLIRSSVALSFEYSTFTPCNTGRMLFHTS